MHTMPTSGWLLLALLGLMAVHAHGQGCNCKAVRLSPKDIPVCDKDGLTYANACLAKCQGVEGIGPCGAAGGVGVAGAGDASAPRPFDAKLLDTTTPLRPGDFAAFKKEGFKLVAKIKMRRGKAWTPQLAKQQSASVAKASLKGVTAARITAAGHLYLKPTDGSMVGSDGSGSAMQASFKGTLPTKAANATTRPGNNRKLLQVLGADDRVQITSFNGAHKFPYRAVGYIRTGCSGALVGPATVLTAGHCVYDTSRRAFYSSLNFIVNRHDGGTHCNSWSGSRCISVEAQREVAWRWVDTWFNNAGPPVPCGDGLTCQTIADFTWDIAVIRLWERIGDQYGSLGVGYNCKQVTYSPVISAGYPASLDPSMSRMFRTSGSLYPFSGCTAQNDTTNGWISSNLDTSPGQSGSAIWDSNGIVRAIIVSSGPGHRTINKFYFDWIFANRV